VALVFLIGTSAYDNVCEYAAYENYQIIRFIASCSAFKRDKRKYMGRSADYTIQGFLYQFNKTLLELLSSSDDDIITIEGIIEDIEIVTPDRIKAIQCKYHETQQVFAISSLYKPLLQMMKHQLSNSDGKIRYHLFAHFPNIDKITLTSADLDSALKSKDKTLKSLIDELKGRVDVGAFLKKFSIEVGPAYDSIVTEACEKMEANGFSSAEVKSLAYPNAIQIIAEFSIKHDATKRKITKRQFLEKLREIKSTAITQWTLALRTRKDLLLARRKQLKTNLAKNSRSRYFLMHSKSLKDFDNQIVIFIKGYLDKYHSKTSHIGTPLFCLDVSESTFNSIAIRLVQKEISLNDGRVAGVFNEALFLREPMVTKEKREFQLRLLRWEAHRELLSKPKADDLFILGRSELVDLNIKDVVLEKIGSDSFDEINYLIGLSDVYE
jgi:hypothetical protein